MLITYEEENNFDEFFDTVESQVVCLSAAPIDIVPDSRYFALIYNHFMQAGVDLQWLPLKTHHTMKSAS